MKNTHKHRKTMTWQSKSAAIAIAIMAMSLHSSVQAMPEQDDQIDRLLRKKLRSPAPERDELRTAADFL